MENDGFEVPIHRSVTEPILVAGVPREVMIINLTLAGVFVLGAHIWLSSRFFSSSILPPYMPPRRMPSFLRRFYGICNKNHITMRNPWNERRKMPDV